MSESYCYYSDSDVLQLTNAGFCFHACTVTYSTGCANVKNGQEVPYSMMFLGYKNHIKKYVGTNTLDWIVFKIKKGCHNSYADHMFIELRKNLTDAIKNDKPAKFMFTVKNGEKFFISIDTIDTAGEIPVVRWFDDTKKQNSSLFCRFIERENEIDILEEQVEDLKKTLVSAEARILTLRKEAGQTLSSPKKSVHDSQSESYTYYSDTEVHRLIKEGYRFHTCTVTHNSNCVDGKKGQSITYNAVFQAFRSDTNKYIITDALDWIIFQIRKGCHCSKENEFADFKTNVAMTMTQRRFGDFKFVGSCSERFFISVATIDNVESLRVVKQFDFIKTNSQDVSVSRSNEDLLVEQKNEIAVLESQVEDFKKALARAEARILTLYTEGVEGQTRASLMEGALRKEISELRSIITQNEERISRFEQEQERHCEESFTHIAEIRELKKALALKESNERRMAETILSLQEQNTSYSLQILQTQIAEKIARTGVAVRKMSVATSTEGIATDEERDSYEMV